MTQVKHVFKWFKPLSIDFKDKRTSANFRTGNEADEVYVRGTFDNWGKSNKLSKTSSGCFETEIILPLNEKVSYKVNPPTLRDRLKHTLTYFILVLCQWKLGFGSQFS